MNALLRLELTLICRTILASFIFISTFLIWIIFSILNEQSTQHYEGSYLTISLAITLLASFFVIVQSTKSEPIVAISPIGPSQKIKSRILFMATVSLVSAIIVDCLVFRLSQDLQTLITRILILWMTELSACLISTIWFLVRSSMGISPRIAFDFFIAILYVVGQVLILDQLKSAQMWLLVIPITIVAILIWLYSKIYINVELLPCYNIPTKGAKNLIPVSNNLDQGHRPVVTLFRSSYMQVTQSIFVFNILLFSLLPLQVWIYFTIFFIPFIFLTAVNGWAPFLSTPWPRQRAFATIFLPIVGLFLLVSVLRIVMIPVWNDFKLVKLDKALVLIENPMWAHGSKIKSEEASGKYSINTSIENQTIAIHISDFLRDVYNINTDPDSLLVIHPGTNIEKREWLKTINEKYRGLIYVAVVHRQIIDLIIVLIITLFVGNIFIPEASRSLLARVKGVLNPIVFITLAVILFVIVFGNILNIEYYETLCAFYNYCEDQFIPVICVALITAFLLIYRIYHKFLNMTLDNINIYKKSTNMIPVWSKK